MLPDVDVLGLRFGVPYGELFGHRGVTHSLFFAGPAALVVTSLFQNKARVTELMQIFVCIFAATASHGMLDALTNGGLGVAFFVPFDPTRYFFPVRPILVSPIGVKAFLSQRGLSVLFSEMVWVWTSSFAVVFVARFTRCRTEPKPLSK